MSLIDNIKNIREEKELKQIEVANHIRVDKSAYSKIEKGTRALAIEGLQRMAEVFGMTTNQILNYNGKIPEEVVIEDKTADALLEGNTVQIQDKELLEQFEEIQKMSGKTKEMIQMFLDMAIRDFKTKQTYQK